MKKILILSNNINGLYLFRRELLCELLHPNAVCSDCQTMPCEVVIAAPEDEYADDLKNYGCRTIDVPIDRRGMNPFKDLRQIYKTSKVLNAEKPDIVLTYTIKPNIYGGFLCKIKKIPYIANVTGLGTSIEGKGFISKIILWMYRLALSSARTVFFQNKENMESFNLCRTGSLIPGSGVNLDLNTFESYPEDKGDLRFLFVGRIMRDKGITEFLDCAEYIKEKYPNTSFDVIGSYEEEEYRSRIEHLHESGIIHYYGRRNDVHEFMKMHHALILPTYHEGLSNVILESAATGRPVIATNIPGCREAFDDGITGIGFEPKSSESLIRAVEKFIALPYSQKQQMGVAGRKKVEAEFDRKKVVEAYLKAMNI